MTDRFATWDGRVGREARLEYERAARRGMAGVVTIFTAAVANCMATLLGNDAVAGVIIAVGFIVGVPLLILAIRGMYRTMQLVLDRYHLPNEAKKSLKFSAMNNAAVFDAWLAEQLRRYGNRSPYAGPGDSTK